MKVSELSGALLDYWVARADESWKWAHELFPTMTLDPTFGGVEYRRKWLNGYSIPVEACILIPRNPMRQGHKWFQPSTDWEHGGTIIERERIELYHVGEGDDRWRACNVLLDWSRVGPTPLIAAMRTVVACKFGEEVPDEVWS